MPEREHVCIVGGAGHVGLPLGLSFAVQGVPVDLVDIDAEAVALVNAGRMPFRDDGCDEILPTLIGRTLRATTDAAAVSRATAVIIATGTPVDEHLNPDIGQLTAVCDQVQPHLRDGQLVILRSTIYPGTTTLVRDRLGEQTANVGLAFCPERVAQGKAFHEIRTLPQIVAAFTDAEFERAAALFRRIAPAIVRLDPLEGELAKLFANTWRYVEFAIANQLYMIAETYGVDFHRVYGALTQDYPRAASFARPGFTAGPCLFKDTMQLSAFHSNAFFLGHAAMLVNEGMPDFLVRRLKARTTIRRRVIGILGMAFKPESDDARDSLSYKLAKILRAEGAVVLCTDPYVPDPDLTPLEVVLDKAETLILACPHRPYARLDLRGRDVIDPWGALSATR